MPISRCTILVDRTTHRLDPLHPGRRRRAPQWTCVLAVLTAALWGLPAAAGYPAPAVLHQWLREAAPAEGSELDRAPAELRLLFSEPVNLGLTTLRLDGPRGPVELGELRVAAGSPYTLVASVDGAVLEGAHTVTWRTVGADGHPVSGSYSFVVAEGAEGVAAPAVGAPTEPLEAAPPPPAEPGTPVDLASPAFVAVRWLNLAALLLVLGAVAYRVLVLGMLERFGVRGSGRLVAAQQGRVAAIGAAAATALILAAVARLAAQSLAVFGPEVTEQPGLASELLVRGYWAAGWWIQVAAAPIALLGFVAARRGRGTGWAIAALAALALAVTPGLSGHAAATGDLAPLAIGADALHVLGAGGWVGAVLILATVGLSAVLGLEREERAAAAAGLLSTFSPVALSFGAVAAVSGVFLAWVHIGSLDALWPSEYGRTLLVKLGIVALVAGIGAFNWLRLKPALRGRDRVQALRGSATLEASLGAVVVLVTAVLIATPRPVDAPPDAAASHVEADKLHEAEGVAGGRDAGP